jgi:hypothetical protein
MNFVRGCVAPDMTSANWGRRTREVSSLGKLVHFDKRGRPAKPRLAVPGNAQIYIFTGVRYERDGTPVPSKPVTGAARAKRKRV